MSDLHRRLESLAGLAHADGGWGYAPLQPAHLEPTCLALLALSLEPEQYQSVIDRGLQALERHATPDGAYRLSRKGENYVKTRLLAS